MLVKYLQNLIIDNKIQEILFWQKNEIKKTKLNCLNDPQPTNIGNLRANNEYEKKMYNFLGYSQSFHFQNINCRWGDSNVQVMASSNF